MPAWCSTPTLCHGCLDWQHTLCGETACSASHAQLGIARMPALSSFFAICSMKACAVQHACLQCPLGHLHCLAIAYSLYGIDTCTVWHTCSVHHRFAPASMAAPTVPYLMLRNTPGRRPSLTMLGQGASTGSPPSSQKEQVHSLW